MGAFEWRSPEKNDWRNNFSAASHVQHNIIYSIPQAVLYKYCVLNIREKGEKKKNLFEINEHVEGVRNCADDGGLESHHVLSNGRQTVFSTYLPFRLSTSSLVLQNTPVGSGE